MAFGLELVILRRTACDNSKIRKLKEPFDGNIKSGVTFEHASFGQVRQGRGPMKVLQRALSRLCPVVLIGNTSLLNVAITGMESVTGHPNRTFRCSNSATGDFDEIVCNVNAAMNIKL